MEFRPDWHACRAGRRASGSRPDESLEWEVRKSAASLSQGVVDGERHVYRQWLKGVRKNEDIVV